MLWKVFNFIKLKLATAQVEAGKEHRASYGVHLHITRNES